MLANQMFPSINQLAIEVKLIETWKAMNTTNYPTKMNLGKDESPKAERILRESTTRELKDNSKTKIGEIKAGYVA